MPTRNTEDVFSIKIFPQEILLSIISFLDPYNVLILGHVNKRFSLLTKDETYWQHKVEEHWPRAPVFEIDCFSRFVKNYQRRITTPGIACLSIFAKEGQLDALKKMDAKKSITREEIDKIFDNAVDFRWTSKHQIIFDYLFTKIETKDSYDHIDLEIALDCHQLAWLKNQLHSEEKWHSQYRGTIISRDSKIEELLLLIIEKRNIPLGNYLDILQFLLDEGLDINSVSRNRVPLLHLAAFAWDFAAVEFLIQNKADVNLTNTHRDHIADDNTPLVCAINNLSSIERLIEKKATAVAIIATLLQHGANPHIQNGTGETPLHLATHHNTDIHCRMIELLLTYGARLETPTRNGYTPLQLAVDCNNLKVTQLLIKKGANLDVISRDLLAPDDFYYCRRELIQTVWIAKINKYVHQLEKKRSFSRTHGLYDEAMIQKINEEKKAAAHLLYLVSKREEGQVMDSEKFTEIINRSDLKTLYWEELLPKLSTKQRFKI